MASLAAAGSDDEREREMLTHAEDTFIDNLSSLKTKNLFEETVLLQSLHDDASLLKNNLVLAVKSEKLGGVTPFEYLNSLGAEWGIKFDKLEKNITAEREELYRIRAELEKNLVKTQNDKTDAVAWAKHKRVSVLDSMIDDLKSKIYENKQQDEKLVENYQQARVNFDTLKAIAMICSIAEMEYNSKKAEAELLAGESAKTDETVKKKKKKKKKKKAPITVVTQEETAKVEPKDTPPEEMSVVSSIPEEEDTEDTEPKKKAPTKEEIEKANLLINKIVELFSYLKEKGIYNEERKKRNATFKRAVDLQEKLKYYFKNTFIPLLNEKNLNFIITGGYATRLLSGGNYVTDDIDIKVYPTKQTEEMTIEQIRDEAVKILKGNPPEGFNSFFKFYDRAKTPADRQNGNIPFKITAPINVGEYHDPDMGDWIPISEITFTTESPSPNNIREVDGFNVSSPTVLIDNLLRAIGHNYKERIADAERLRNEKQPHENIYPGKVLSWFWQLQQLLYLVYPSFKEELQARLTSLTKQGGKKTRKYKKKKRKTKRRKKKTRKQRGKGSIISRFSVEPDYTWNVEQFDDNYYDFYQANRALESYMNDYGSPPYTREYQLHRLEQQRRIIDDFHNSRDIRWQEHLARARQQIARIRQQIGARILNEAELPRAQTEEDFHHLMQNPYSGNQITGAAGGGKRRKKRTRKKRGGNGNDPLPVGSRVRLISDANRGFITGMIGTILEVEQRDGHEGYLYKVAFNQPPGWDRVIGLTRILPANKFALVEGGEEGMDEWTSSDEEDDDDHDDEAPIRPYRPNNAAIAAGGRKKKGGLLGPRELEEGRQYLYTGPEPHIMPQAEWHTPVRITVTYRGRNVPGLTPNQHYFDGERAIARDGHSLDIFSLDNAEIEQHIQPWAQNPGPSRVTNPSGVYARRARRESMCENCTIMGGGQGAASRAARRRKSKKRRYERKTRKTKKTRKKKRKKHKQTRRR